MASGNLDSDILCDPCSCQPRIGERAQKKRAGVCANERALCAGEEGQLTLWDLRSSVALCEVKGYFASCAFDGTVKLWQIQEDTLEEISAMPRKHQETVVDCCATMAGYADEFPEDASEPEATEDPDMFRNVRLSWMACGWTLATTLALLLHVKTSGREVGRVGREGRVEKTRLLQFNGWQFVICCIIIWHHYCDPSIFSQLAYASVTFFVFFSGFITQYAYGDKMAGPKANLISYYIRRVGRVLPIYYGIHFMVLLSNGQSWSTDFQGSVLMLCTWHGSAPSSNFPAWTVCALLWCWLFAPLPSKLIFWARQSFGHGELYSLTLWSLLVLLGALDEFWSRTAPLDEDMDLDFWFYETRHNVFIFTLGLCTCEVALSLPPAKGPYNWFWPVWCDVTLLGFLLLTAKWNYETGLSGLSWGSSFWSGCFAPVAVWVLSSTVGYQSLLHRLSSHRLLQMLGDYSMQIYLLANPVHDLLPETDPIFLYASILAISVALTDLLEEPLHRRLKTFSDRLQQPGGEEEDPRLLADA
ncbi:unnamed protein product [Durusdinium trenchii]|uniref:Acyltransferase 3 domain-containing protein n=1 Tax=Durusdinium trenchii TaxID=1381693 RepID=A0ABP0LMS6_9DINO